MTGIFIMIAAVLAALVVLPKKAGAMTETKVLSPDSTEALIVENAKRFALDAALIKAFIRVESNFDRNAVNPIGPGNTVVSYGLMQITPALAEDYGLVHEYQNVTEAEIAMMMQPATNVRIGSWHVARLFKLYTFEEAVQMYNVGVTGYRNGRRNADYLAKITRWYNEYKRA